MSGTDLLKVEDTRTFLQECWEHSAVKGGLGLLAIGIILGAGALAIHYTAPDGFFKDLAPYIIGGIGSGAAAVGGAMVGAIGLAIHESRQSRYIVDSI